MLCQREAVLCPLARGSANEKRGSTRWQSRFAKKKRRSTHCQSRSAKKKRRPDDWQRRSAKRKTRSSRGKSLADKKNRRSPHRTRGSDNNKRCFAHRQSRLEETRKRFSRSPSCLVERTVEVPQTTSRRTRTERRLSRATVTLSLPKSLPALIVYEQGIVRRMTGQLHVLGSTNTHVFCGVGGAPVPPSLKVAGPPALPPIPPT